MPATWSMPSSAATWRHWSTASDSIQLCGEANTVTRPGTPPGTDDGKDDEADERDDGPGWVTKVPSEDAGTHRHPVGAVRHGSPGARGTGAAGSVRQNVMRDNRRPPEQARNRFAGRRCTTGDVRPLE